MSYILDALRRADAERERGEVPNLQSQQQTILPDDDEAPRRSRVLVGAVGALSVAVVALLGWNLFGGTASSSAPPATTTMAQGTVSPNAPTTGNSAAPPVSRPLAIDASNDMSPRSPPGATMAAAVPAPAPPPATPPTSTSRRASPPDASSDAVRSVTETTTTADASPRPRSPPIGDAKRPTRDTRAAPTKTVAMATPAAASPGDKRVVGLNELPDDVRRELPKVSINGASYSSDAASRMVMINGQVFHEGDKLGNGLVLEKIKLKSAIMGYKGWRYEVSF